MLKIINLHKSFGENHVLNGINLSLEQGKIYTLIGGNGTGKTTLFNMITGFIKPDKEKTRISRINTNERNGKIIYKGKTRISQIDTNERNGKIIYKGTEINKKTPVTINNLGITRTFQDLRIINGLSVNENILLSFKNNPGEKILNSILPEKLFEHKYNEYSLKADEIINKIHLQDVANNLAGEISYGQQKLLTLGCCIANNADLMLLDEPVAGIDKDNYKRIYELILNFKKEGKTILQIEHRHDFVESLSDGIWFLNTGKAYYFENYKAFISNNIVKEVYLN